MPLPTVLHLVRGDKRVLRSGRPRGLLRTWADLMVFGTLQ